MLRTQIAFALLCLVPASAVRAADQPAPTFTKDIAPILFSQCAACHRPGAGAPFSLLTYKDAKKRGKLITRVTQSKQMPPWKAEKGDVAFGNERHLSDAQIAVLKAWAESDMAEGNPADLPAVPNFADGWALGKPDLVVKMPKSYHVPAEGRDIYRNFAVALGLKEDKWVRAIDFRPGAPSVLHHSLFFLDTSGTAAKREADSGEVGSRGGMGAFGRQSGGRPGAGRLGGNGALGVLSGLGGSSQTGGLGGWAVGGQARALPDGLAYSLPKGSDLILSTHFHPSGKAEEEASTIALYFTDKPPVKRFTGIQLPPAFGILAGINIPAGKKDFMIQDSFTLPIDAKGFGISAHAHYLAKTIRVTATFPDKTEKTLLSISDWDFTWQEQYQFKSYVDLPKGTKVHAAITYDNSADNPHNPTSPPKHVRWGKESTDEMGSITLQVVAANEAEFPRLQEAYRTHLVSGLNSGALRRFKDK
jgi:mono/diheme cytochrome c family protein